MTLASDLPLPACSAPAGSVAELRVRRGDLPSRRLPDNTVHHVEADEDRATVWIQGAGSFRVDATEIVVDALPQADPAVVRHLTVGTALAIALYYRGRHVLHGAAVAIAGHAVGIVGESGAGKSTLATALWRRGHALVSDDMMALELREGHPWTHPGAPQIKLWPPSVAAVDLELGALSPLFADSEKRRLDAAEHHAAEPLPLGVLYALQHDEQDGIDALRPNDAFAELVRHSHVSKTLGADAEAGKRRHFFQAIDIADHVPIRRLRVRRSLEALADLARRVERDALSLLTPR